MIFRTDLGKLRYQIIQYTWKKQLAKHNLEKNTIDDRITIKNEPGLTLETKEQIMIDPLNIIKEEKGKLPQKYPTIKSEKFEAIEIDPFVLKASNPLNLEREIKRHADHQDQLNKLSLEENILKIEVLNDFEKPIRIDERDNEILLLEAK